MSTNEQSPAPVAAGTRETSNYQAVRTDHSSVPRYFKHKVVRRAAGISYSLCGHSRPTVDSRRIITELGDSWATTPECTACRTLSRLELELKNQRRADAIAALVLRHLNETEE